MRKTTFDFPESGECTLLKLPNGDYDTKFLNVGEAYTYEYAGMKHAGMIRVFRLKNKQGKHIYITLRDFKRLMEVKGYGKMYYRKHSWSKPVCKKCDKV